MDASIHAFPTHALNVPLNDAGDPRYLGMTLRDYFAAKAMQSITSVLHKGIRPADLDAMARDAYGIADAMLKARAA